MAKKQYEQPATFQPMPIAPKRPSIVFRTMNNCAPVPVSKPADFVQLTPIVQPIALVPYSSQDQPMAMFEDEQ